MGVLEKDRPRGLRVPSLSSFRSKNKTQPEPAPAMHIPSPSQLGQADSLPAPYQPPADKALPSPPDVHSPEGLNPYPSPPQSYTNQPAPVPNQNRNIGPDIPLPPLPADRPMPRPIPSTTPPPARRPLPKSATATVPATSASAASESAPIPTVTTTEPTVYAPAPKPVPSVNSIVAQERTPPLSEGESEQRNSSGSNDSLEDLIPEPEPERESELDRTGRTPNGTGSSSEDDNRPFTPPEVEPFPVPLNKLHYSCYQEHRAMPAAANVWYALPCMTCHKFDREIRHRCVFCCLRVCADCHQALQKIPRRSLTQLMQTVNGAESQPAPAF
ncbi:hypothetical protein BDV18DRAFT_46952 [Aspergillus unguis]